MGKRERCTTKPRERGRGVGDTGKFETGNICLVAHVSSFCVWRGRWGVGEEEATKNKVRRTGGCIPPQRSLPVILHPDFCLAVLIQKQEEEQPC